MKKKYKLAISLVSSFIIASSSICLSIYNYPSHISYKNKSISTSHSHSFNTPLTLNSSNGLTWNLNASLLDTYVNGWAQTLDNFPISPWINNGNDNNNYSADMSNLQIPYDNQLVSLKMVSAKWLVNHLTNNMLASLLEQSIITQDSSFANDSNFIEVSNLKITQVQDNAINNIQNNSNNPWDIDSQPVTWNYSNYINQIIDSKSSTSLSINNTTNFTGNTSNFMNSVYITYDMTWTNKTIENQFYNSYLSINYSFGSLTINDLAIDATNASNQLWDNIKNNTITINLTNNNPAFLQDFYELKAWLYNSKDFGYNAFGSSNSSSLSLSEWLYLNNILFQYNVPDNPNNLPINSYVQLSTIFNNQTSNLLSLTSTNSLMINNLPSYFVFGNGYYQAPNSPYGLSGANNGKLDIQSNYPTYVESPTSASNFTQIPFSFDLAKNNISKKDFVNAVFNVYLGDYEPNESVSTLNNNSALITQSNTLTTTSWQWQPTWNGILSINSAGLNEVEIANGIYGFPMYCDITVTVSNSSNPINIIQPFYLLTNSPYYYADSLQNSNGVVINPYDNLHKNIYSFLNNQSPIQMPQIKVENLNYIANNINYNFQINAKNTSYANSSIWDVMKNANSLDLSSFYQDIKNQFDFEYNGIDNNLTYQKIFESDGLFHYISLNNSSLHLLNNACAMTLSFNSTNQEYNNRFIELQNNLGNSKNKILSLICSTNLYNNLNLNNISLSSLESNFVLNSVTLPFNSMILYNLNNNYYLPQSIDLKNINLDLNDYTFNALKTITNNTWMKIINTLISNYFFNINGDLTNYYNLAYNQNLTIDSYTITLSQSSTNTYLNINIINHNSTPIIINNITFLPQKSTILPIKLIGIEPTISKVIPIPKIVPIPTLSPHKDNSSPSKKTDSSSSSQNKNDSQNIPTKNDSSSTNHKQSTINHHESKPTSSHDKKPTKDSLFQWIPLIIILVILFFSTSLILIFLKLKYEKK